MNGFLVRFFVAVVNGRVAEFRLAMEMGGRCFLAVVVFFWSGFGVALPEDL